ncbi:hypothetical protein GF402_03410 [Candidatus Fermentibacteria bacterium]|nr:hypothetical protein [Candidatus Fermentibacteria bacterium]
MRSAFPILLCFLLLTGCTWKEEPDRMVGPDGQLVVGELTGIEGRLARFDGLEVSLPEGPARVRLRNGASYLGAVAYDGDALTIEGGTGTLRRSLDDVSSMVWGATGAESYVFDVPAGFGWYNTHVVVSRGTPLGVVAAGTVSEQTGTAGPGGQERYSSTAAAVPEATHGQLVMRIGEASNPVSVGDAWSGPAGSDGEVYFAVNSVGDSSYGYFTVTLLVEEAPISSPCVIYPAGD